MTIAAGVAAAILTHARESGPRECCGLLLGDSWHIASAVRAKNLADDPAHADTVKAMKALLPKK